MLKWKQLFKPHILERGMEYYYAGCVDGIDEEEGQLFATVEGTEDYDVVIDTDGGRVLGMTCTCPYAEGGEHCKHMAAVLCAWTQGGSPAKAASKAAQDGFAQLKACVEGADEALVRRFLTDALWQNDKLRLRFMAEAQPERVDDYARAVEAMVDGVVDRYAVSDYLDEYEEDGFTGELQDILDDEIKPLLERGLDREAFARSARVFLALDEVEEYDSNGGIAILADQCQALWETLAGRADAAMTREMFDWLQENCDDLADGYLKICCEETLMRCFDQPEYLQRKLARARAALDAKLCGYDGARDYSAGRLAAKCLRLMEQLGRPEAELDAFAASCPQLPDMRKYRIEKRRQAGRWAEVVDLLRAAINRDAAAPGDVADCHMQLKDAYAALGRQDEYRRELWAIVTDHFPGHLDCYREYRALFAPEDWPAERERLFAALPARADIAALYAEEALYDRLLALALAQDGLFLLRKYEDVLAERYPDAVLEKYAESVNAVARDTATRAEYRDWVKALAHMRTLPGGPAVVDGIVADWRVRYRRRAAMMEELNAL